MASSKRWASVISFIASCAHFLIIIFQVPLFRNPPSDYNLPLETQHFYLSWVACLGCDFLVVFSQWVSCRSGACTSPVEVACSHLIATELFPVSVVRALLYPGAILEAFINGKPFPSYAKLLKLYKFTNLEKASAATDLQHLEILAGSYLSVAGTLLGVPRPLRMSLIGELLIIWGFLREFTLRKSAYTNHIRASHIYPAMYITALCAFLSMRKGVRQLIRCCRCSRVPKPLQSKPKYL